MRAYLSKLKKYIGVGVAFMTGAIILYFGSLLIDWNKVWAEANPESGTLHISSPFPETWQKPLPPNVRLIQTPRSLDLGGRVDRITTSPFDIFDQIKANAGQAYAWVLQPGSYRNCTQEKKICFEYVFYPNAPGPSSVAIDYVELPPLPAFTAPEKVRLDEKTGEFLLSYGPDRREIRDAEEGVSAGRLFWWIGFAIIMMALLRMVHHIRLKPAVEVPATPAAGAAFVDHSKFLG